MADMGHFREAVAAWAGGADGEAARELVERLGVTTAVLLEGPSDVAAVTALAQARARDLPAEGVCVLPIGGAMSIGRYARLLGPAGLGLRLTGLCDEGEQGFYARGVPHHFVCSADLEDELIRALGVPRVTALIRTEGDERALHTFLRQPAQRLRTPDAQLRRFLGTKKGRKIHYARVLTAALPPDRVPPPLTGLLAAL